MNNQYCPICKSEVKSLPRYPNYVCSSCLSGGVYLNGVSVPIENLDVTKNPQILCLVKNVECKATESRFGGVVIEAL
jgi:hypothetical protein